MSTAASMSSPCTIRPAQASDLRSITEIYNDAVRTTVATFDIIVRTAEQQERWFRNHGPRHPILVAELDGDVVGWACLTRWSDRAAYDDTAETSFYVAAPYRGRGVGKALKCATIEEARRLGFHSLIARVAEGADASGHLNEAFGFVHVGTLKEVGKKFDRLLDVHIYQLMLS